MKTPILDLPTSSALEREIEIIEAQSHDERICKTITERMAVARDPQTIFVPHEDVFSASKARLLARLTGKVNA